jgi:tetratricopeptide (TPR) repeat protein
MVIGWLVVATTMDRIFSRSDPALALSWNPDSADANARRADILSEEGNLAKVQDRIKYYATRSFSRQLVNPAAARQLGIVASQGNPNRAERLLRYAEAMSRRDLPTQIWLIESHIQRNDIEGALKHYDRALRTNFRARALLFPILNQAAADPAVWQPLAGVLRTRPQWWRAFLEQYISVSTTPEALFAFARAMGMDRVPSVDPWLLQATQKRLVDLFAYSQAATLYNHAHGQSGNVVVPLRNGDFEQPGSADPFDWNLVDEQDLAAQRQPSPSSKGGNALFLSATNGRGGDLATQLTILPLGRYTVTARVGGVSGDPVAFPQFTVRCARTGKEILRQSFPPASDAGRTWQFGLDIPAGCQAQRIILRADGSMTPQDTAPWIDDIIIRSGKTY